MQVASNLDSNRFLIGDFHNPDARTQDVFLLQVTDDYGNLLELGIFSWCRAKHFIGAHVAMWDL